MKTLVFFHGWGASGQVWQEQVTAFQDQAQVLTPAIPVWDAVWMADYLQTLPLANCLLIGWSLGGMLLLESLSSLEGPPSLGLALVGVPALFCRRLDHPGGSPAPALRAMRRALKDDPARVLQDFADQCLAPGEAAYQSQARSCFNSPGSPANLAQGLDYLLHQDLRNRLHGVSGRAAVIQGAEDRIVAAVQGEFLSRQLPQARLCLLPGAGHLPFLTQTGAFNRIVGELLGLATNSDNFYEDQRRHPAQFRPASRLL